jgi:tripartite-type tricarboxylate transporter receptor subunit TctC
MSRFFSAPLVAALVLVPAFVSAQSYPSRAITMVSLSGAGSGPDVLIRAVGQKLTEAWRQPVIIENKPSAGGVVGSEQVARSAPDGYTLLVHTAAHTIAPSMYKLPYDTLHDFAPVTRLANAPNTIAVHPTLPVKNVKELIALAKARPGAISYSSSGSGTPAHLSGELFKATAKVDLLHVPYRGSPASMTGLLSGETSIMFAPIALALPHAKSGRLRLLGITTATRSKIAPELPTIAESGLPGYEVAQWYGIQAPRNTPKDVIAKLNAEIGKILAMPSIVERYQAQGAEPAPSTPEALEAYVRSEMTKWAGVVKGSGATRD